MAPLPMVGTGDDKVDVISRLLRDRILLLGTQVDDEIANVLVAQMLYLGNEDASADMTMYINSPGGSVSAGMAIFDTMQFVPCDTNTVCFGTAASMGAFLLGAGCKGKRRSLPNSRIMIHQPLGGAQGQGAPAARGGAGAGEGGGRPSGGAVRSAARGRARPREAALAAVAHAARSRAHAPQPPTLRSRRRRSSSSARCCASTLPTTRGSRSRRSRTTATATSS